MSTVLHFPDIYEPISDVTGPPEQSPASPPRLSTKLRVVSSEEETQSREPIRIEELYSAPEAMVPELETGLRLLAEGINYSEEAIRAYEEDNTILADDSMLKLQALLPELFCCRGLGDGFGLVINAVTAALQGLQGLPPTASQVRAVANALNLIRSMPFLKTEVATDEVSKLESEGLCVDPPGFDEFMSGMFDD